MESSPLTQQTRPETFQPKIVKLYETLLFVRYFSGLQNDDIADGYANVVS